jgi:hypothetical protein
MLSSKCFTADSAHEGTLIGMSSQVRAQVISSGESLGTQGTLKGRRVLLHALACAGFLAVLILRVRQA